MGYFHSRRRTLCANRSFVVVGLVLLGLALVRPWKRVDSDGSEAVGPCGGFDHRGSSPSCLHAMGWQTGVTYVSIHVVERFKGERRRSILIGQLGGKIGAYRVVVAGMPEFKGGDHLVVFLRASGDGTYQVVGLNQGKYLVVENYAVSNLSGVDDESKDRPGDRDIDRQESTCRRAQG